MIAAVARGVIENSLYRGKDRWSQVQDEQDLVNHIGEVHGEKQSTLPWMEVHAGRGEEQQKHDERECEQQHVVVYALDRDLGRGASLQAVPVDTLWASTT